MLLFMIQSCCHARILYGKRVAKGSTNSLQKLLFLLLLLCKSEITYERNE